MDSKVIVALDFATENEALAFVDRIDVSDCRLKVGKQLFTSAGPRFVRRLVENGADVFLDLKFHDIPNTVGEACRAAVDLGVWMLNVHAMGGLKMLEHARRAVSSDSSLLIAVTLLTSSDEMEMAQIGVPGQPKEFVNRLAALSHTAGLDGVVCSAQDAPDLRASIGDTFTLVTPGIRRSDSTQDDQKRIVTPRQAVDNGASYLVIGRPITKAKDPAAVLTQINSELNL
ncbi:MAG: orotidine-5'-phosphate decarboxylase [Pseudomonadota bacterium]